MLSLNILHGKYLVDSEGHSYGQLVIGSFITTTCLLRHHVYHRDFWWNRTPRWLSPHTAQVRCPVTSGFSQNQTHLWKGRDFRLSVRFRKIRWGSWMAIGRTVWGLKLPTLKGTEASLSFVQSFLYLVTSSINVSIFHSTWLDTFWVDLVYI